MIDFVPIPADAVENPPPPGPAAPPKSPPPNFVSRSLWQFRHVIAIGCWVYVICKLFVFDIDVALIGLIDPELVWVTNYKAFLFAGILSLALVIVRPTWV